MWMLLFICSDTDTVCTYIILIVMLKQPYFNTARKRSGRRVSRYPHLKGLYYLNVKEMIQ